MRRREFITTLSGVAAASTTGLPNVAQAQRPEVPLIGLLYSQSLDAVVERLRKLHSGLKEVGFVEGDNVAFLYRWAENQIDHLPTLAAELRDRQVSIIIAGNTLSALSAKAATPTIPIVFAVNEDPVMLGLVGSLARPGGNVTGVNYLTAELVAKRLELLRDIMPEAARFAVLVNPANATNTETTVREAEAAARVMGLQIRILKASTSGQINEVFATIANERPDALFVTNDGFFNSRRVQLATLAARHAVPATFHSREIPEVGGLMSYGADIADAWRQVGVYTGRILEGAKPADLPVVQASKFELVINTQTASILGLSVPESLLARADKVID